MQQLSAALNLFLNNNLDVSQFNNTVSYLLDMCDVGGGHRLVIRDRPTQRASIHM